MSSTLIINDEELKKKKKFAVKDFGHIDWGVRMRVIMGISYCLQYMHHELNPHVAHPHLQSSCIYLTDDFAAKVTGSGKNQNI